MADQSGGDPSALTSELIDGAAARLLVRLGNTVRDLQVFRYGGGVVLSGRTSTYHAKQLAQHAAMEIFEDANVVNEIVVR